jgi:hypothetical protein
MIAAMGFIRERIVQKLRKKQAPVPAVHPFQDVCILQQVLAFLPGNHLFVGAVCKDWKAVYANIQQHQICSISLERKKHFKLAPCGSKTLLYSAVVATPVAARWAHSCGLAVCSNTKLQVIAGFCADVQTLAHFHELGMSLDDTPRGPVVDAVALSGR